MAVRIFYLEDEPFLAQVVVESLMKKGYEVCHVVSGGEAMEKYLGFNPDLCILDVMVPVMDGYEIGKRIRRRDQAIPIIFLTAKVQSADVVEGFKSGGTDYLKKPFSMEELQVRIEHQLKWGRTESKSNNEYEFGAFNFNADKQELTTLDDTIRMSYRESQLMKFLLDNREGISKRKDILLTLWGDDSYFNSRNLDVYIKKLRNYLKVDGKVQIITLKGVGYRLVEE